MKKILSSLLLIATAAMALSCNKEQLKNNDVHESGNVSVFHIFASTSETKSVFGTKEDGAYPTLWTVNKNVAFSRDEAEFVEGTPILPEGEDAAKTVTFDVELPGEAEAGTIYAFSPMGVYDRESPSNNVPGFTSINAKYLDAYLNIPAEQTPLANSVDESAQAIFGKVDYSAGKYDLNMSFSHVVAYGKMAITNFAGGAIESVAITFPENIVGSSCYYYYAGEKAGTISNMDGKTITLDPENVVDNTFWFALAPTAGDEGAMKIVITDSNNDTYTKTIDLTKKALPFEKGKVSSFNVNFSGIAADEKVSAENIDFAKGSIDNNVAIWPGKACVIKQERNTSTTNPAYTNPPRWYKAHKITFTENTGYSIYKVEVTCNTNAYATVLSGSTYSSDAKASVAGDVVTIETEGDFSIIMKDQSRIASIKVYYSLESSKVLSSLALSGTYPTKFNTGDEFSHEGMIVTATYDDETTADVTENASFSGYDMATPGEQTVTVSYTEVETTKTAQYTITVIAVPIILADDITDVPAIGGELLEHTYTPQYFTSDDVEVASVDGKVVTDAICEDGTIFYTVAPNYTTTAKSGTITLQSASNPDITKTINVSQLKSNLSVSDTEIVIPYNATTATFTLTSNDMGWNVDVSAAEGMNLSVDKNSGEKADAEQTITITSTTEPSTNEVLSLGTIYVYRNGNTLDSQKKTITVMKAKDPGAGIVGLPTEFSMTSGTASTISGTGNNDATLKYFNASGSLTNMSGYGSGFAVSSIPTNAYFLITIPGVSLLSDSVLELTMGGVKTSNTKYPATYQVSWSIDGTNFTNVGDTFTSTTAAKTVVREMTPGAITAGTLYIKVKCTTGTTGGNNYLGTVTVSTK